MARERGRLIKMEVRLRIGVVVRHVECKVNVNWEGRRRKLGSKFACSPLTFIKKCQFCSQTCRWRCDFYKKSFFISSISFISSDSPVIWNSFELTVEFYHSVCFTCKAAAGMRGELKSRNQYFEQLSLLFNCRRTYPASFWRHSGKSRNHLVLHFVF
jgi:hypothetical protein